MQKPSAPHPPANPLLTGAILPTLARLSLPNIVALSAQSLVVIAETGYIGRLGTEALAAMALVFPMIMLMQMMSSGAMGGGVSSAISRAMGAGQPARAAALALCAAGIGLAAGLVLSVFFLVSGHAIYAVLGGQGSVLAAAEIYSRTFFAGAVAIWAFNTLVSVVRGTGNMALSSALIIGVGLLQILLGGVLSLGLGSFGGMGLPGVALAQILAYTTGAAVLAWHLLGRGSAIRNSLATATPTREMCLDILRVGAVACLSPLQSILVVILLARFAARFGPERLAGFGIGVRLELLLVPIAFAIGVACVPMVGMAIGAGRVARARRVAWTGALLSGGMIGAIGLVLATHPLLWGRLFSSNGEVLAAVSEYLGIAGLAFPAYGIGLCLYFASQGAGRIVGPVLGGSVRLVTVIAGGAWIMGYDGTFRSLALVVAAAMLAYGASTALFVAMTSWEPRRANGSGHDAAGR